MKDEYALFLEKTAAPYTLVRTTSVELSGSGARDSNPSDRSGVYRLTGFFVGISKESASLEIKNRRSVSTRE